MAKSIYGICLLATMVALCAGSAIPMWEFLGRTEKMSHLYSMFAKDVSKYCRANVDAGSVAKCKHDLLQFGVEKLEKMSESHLDAMDPYQRSANDIIWDSIMEHHPMMKPKETTTSAPILVPSGNYERNPLFDGIDDDQKTDSAHDYAMAMESSDSMDSSFAFPSGPSDVGSSNHLPLASNVEFQFDLPSVNPPTTNYLSGPMVIRVRPDGTPVEEDKLKPLPSDDDREAMTIGQGGLFSSSRLQPPTATKSTYTNYRTISRRQPH